MKNEKWECFWGRKNDENSKFKKSGVVQPILSEENNGIKAIFLIFKNTRIVNFTCPYKTKTFAL